MPTAQDVLAGRAEWAIDTGDNRRWLKGLPSDSVHCILTSPPYYGLRAYLPEGHDAKGNEIGAEETPEQYVESMVAVFRECRRVLRPDGVMWLNLGDSYNNFRNGTLGQALHNREPRDKPVTARRGSEGYKEKDLLGIPWMVAFALRSDGWYLRQWMPWIKRNSMPESANDRPSTACETVFLLTKSPNYFFDMEAVKSRAVGAERVRNDRIGGNKINSTKHSDGAQYEGGDSRNWRSGDLWFESVGALIADGQLLGFDVPVRGRSEAHFAIMSDRLAEPMILAGTSQKGACPHCGKQWERMIEKERTPTRPGDGSKVTGDSAAEGNRDPERHVTRTRTVGWRPGCTCDKRGREFQPDDLEIVETPTGERVGEDPSKTTGRAGMNRPRHPEEGVRPMTRYQQRQYAAQLKASPRRRQMEDEAGEAFAHYLRTDRSGARPVPADLLESWIDRGWLTEVLPPMVEPFPPIPAVVMDPFSGAGTTAAVSVSRGRRAIGCELNPEFAKMARKRVGGVTTGFF